MKHSPCTVLGRGRCDVMTPADLEAARRERLTRAERELETGLPLPAAMAEADLDAGGLDPLDVVAR